MIAHNRTEEEFFQFRDHSEEDKTLHKEADKLKIQVIQITLFDPRKSPP